MTTKRSWMPALIFMVGLIYGFMLGNKIEAQQPKAENDTVEQIKNFLSSASGFQVIAKICNRIPEATNEDFSCAFALVRSQTNGFYYKESPVLSELDSQTLSPRYRWAGYFNNEYWNFSSDGATLMATTNGVGNVRQAVQLVETINASKIINLGVFGTLPNRIQWDGKKLLPFTNSFGLRLQGELDVSNGCPAGLKLVATQNGKSEEWEIKYEYPIKKSESQLLPAKISGFYIGSGERELEFEIQIIEVRLSEAPLSRDWFMPTAATNKILHQILYTPSGNLFRDKLHNSWTPVEQNGGSDRHRTKSLLIILGAINIAIITFLLAKLWRRGNQKPK